MSKLKEIAKVIRSKNAGPFQLTFDIMFSSEDFQDIFIKKPFSPVSIQKVLKIPDISVDKIKVVYYPPAYSVKITIPREVVSGDVDDTDVYGAQQYVPLMDFIIPEIER